MLIDALSFPEAWRTLHGTSLWARSIATLAQLIERRTGGHVLYDGQRIPFEKEDLLDLFEVAETLKAAGVIEGYGAQHRLADEPKMRQWRVDISRDRLAGGCSVDNERLALTAALAEGLERYLWFSATDYFRSPTYATDAEIGSRGRAVHVRSFESFTDEQRNADAKLKLSDSARYLWVRGYSHTAAAKTWVPAQTISGKHGAENFRNGGEPVIVTPITTGLATGPTREFALLNGALEIIERDAFMITWLNQLTPPRIDLAELRRQHIAVDALLAACERYGLTVEAVRLPTDAPAYAVCAIVTDEQAHLPPRTIGLKAHRDLARAVTGALQEAVRIRATARWHISKDTQSAKKTGNQLNHVDRLVYWSHGERYKKLDFLCAGSHAALDAVWQDDNESAHLKRIISWCRERSYELASVSLTDSKKNVTAWHVEMVVMPTLIPIHQNERYRYFGGARRESVARMFGYVPRSHPFTEEPHPFA